MLGKNNVFDSSGNGVKGWLATIFIYFIIVIVIVGIGGLIDDYNAQGLTVLVALSTASVFIAYCFPKVLSFSIISWSMAIIAVLVGIVKYLISVDFDSIFIAPYMAYGLYGRVVFIIITCLLLPVIEEIYFRGLLYPIVSRYTGYKTGAVITITLFTLIHCPSLNAILLLSLSGALYTWLYHRSGSVIPGILAHCANNSMWLILVLKMF